MLVFPNLESGNLACKHLQRLCVAELIGPLLTGLSRRVHVLQRGSEVNDVVHVAAVAVVDAQDVGKLRHADPGIGGLSAKRVSGRNPHALQLRDASWISPRLGGS